MERFSLAALDRASLSLNLHLWPQVNESVISDAKKKSIFKKRRRAIELLLSDASREQIHSETGVSGQQAIQFLKRCLSRHPDGLIYGYRGLIPWLHVVPYRRVASVQKISGRPGAGATGAFGQLLRDYPQLKELIDDQVLKSSKYRHVYESRIPLKALHKRFIKGCRELRLDVGMRYPFNMAKLGYASLSKYVRNLLETNVERAASARFGSDAARKLKTGDGSSRPVLQPLSLIHI